MVLKTLEIRKAQLGADCAILARYFEWERRIVMRSNHIESLREHNPAEGGWL